MSGRVFRAEEMEWVLPPGHHDAFSKKLVCPDNSETKDLDFRVSLVRPQGHIEVHHHAVAENLYYIIRGTGLMELDGERHTLAPNTVIHVPPGVRHGLWNTGFEDLVFVVVALPAHDMPPTS